MYKKPCLYRNVRNYIKNCKLFSLRKNDNVHKSAPMKIVHSGYPQEMRATYIQVSYHYNSKTSKVPKNIGVILDYYTKWTESFAITSMESTTVPRVIQRNDQSNWHTRSHTFGFGRQLRDSSQ